MFICQYFVFSVPFSKRWAAFLCYISNILLFLNKKTPVKTGEKTQSYIILMPKMPDPGK